VSPTTRTLRLALAMRGGVSLSVWIGGAVQEIDALRRDIGPATTTNVLARLAGALGYGLVEVDVVSGASAGGLNGAILAAAMANDKPVAELRDVWLADADLQQLLFPSGGPPRRSILQGDYFLERLRVRFNDLVESDRESPLDHLDLILSVSSIVPYAVVASTDPAQPITERHIAGTIHFRHRSGDPSQLTPDDLALAARSTASFPAAFQPVRIKPGQLAGKLLFRPARPDPVLLYDGGVVDNMPVGKAVRAIETARAEGPTKRWLLYLFPSPSVAMGDVSRAERAKVALMTDGATPMDVLRSATKLVQAKSLVTDLDELEAHNTGVDCRLRDRARLLRTLTAEIVVTNLAGTAAAVTAVPGPAHDLDAERVVDLLRHPWDHLGGLPSVEERLPLLPNAPPTFWSDLRLALTRACATAPLDAPLPLPSLGTGSMRPWSPIIQCASLAIEWCRWLQDQGENHEVGKIKQWLYEARDLGYRRGSELDLSTLDQIVKVDQTISPEKLAAQVLERRRSLVAAHQADAAWAWAVVGALAAQIRALVEPFREPPDVGMVRDWVPFILGSLIPAQATPGEACAALDRVDLVLLPLQRNAPEASLQAIDYRTISGTAMSPLASVFPWPDGVGVQTENAPLQSLRLAEDDSLFDRLGPEHEARCDPASKLAGNQFHNFAAFLDVHWRASDWMWGQADAAATLVDVLLDGLKRRPDMTPAEQNALPQVTADQVKEYCTAPLAAPGREWPAGWAGDLVSAPWTRGATDVVAEELRTRGEHGLPVTRALLLWRRHLEIMATELSRCDRENPTGKAPRDSLAAALTEWDATPRRLADRWGERKPAALGMRAVLVGVRAAFSGVGGPLAFLRSALVVVAGPLASIVLGRRRSVAAVDVLLLGVVLPRTHASPVGRTLVALLAVIVTVTGLVLTRRKKTKSGAIVRPLSDRLWWGAGVAAGLAVVAYAIAMNMDPFRSLLPVTRSGSARLWPYVLLPVGGTVVATLVSWFWARIGWCIAVTIAGGSIAAGWAWLAGHHDAVQCACVIGGAASRFTSFWWAGVALIFLMTLVGITVDVAAYPPSQRRPKLCGEE
jgi:predicted acylesterase/phospholipase RssA